LFWRRKKSVEIAAPLTGRYVPLEEVPDQVFSQKMMGDGFAIEPEKGEVYAPADGEITNLFPTKHAIGIKTKNGLEILIHVGIDTVELEGDGFTAYVSEGDRVSAGQKLLDFDMEKIKNSGKPLITPVIFPESAAWSLELCATGSLQAGETVVARVEQK
jgi:sugar PTS system EIIA component